LINFTKPFFQSGFGFWMTFPEFSYWPLGDDTHGFLKVDRWTPGKIRNKSSLTPFPLEEGQKARPDTFSFSVNVL
jgi:hypothetical protein